MNQSSEWVVAADFPLTVTRMTLSALRLASKGEQDLMESGTGDYQDGLAPVYSSSTLKIQEQLRLPGTRLYWTQDFMKALHV
jgi:hypothetical protein